MDLDSLLNALQTTQQQKSYVRLSERNVVELVLKLKQLGLFGEELLHTINGKEYITTDRLKADIAAALRQAGGRLELTELPALVGVDLVHCEKQAALIVAESSGTALGAQGELITTQYFDSLAAEVNDLLQESGVLSLADLAITYALNTELLRSTISSRMGTVIHGQLEGSLLYTPAYVSNIKAQLRGALRGTTIPVALNTLVKELGLDSFGSSIGMVSQLVDELITEGAVKGSTKGGGGNWVPTIYTAAQQQAVTGFYQQNGWVAYDLVRKAGISNEKTYLKQNFPEGLALDTVYVSSTIISQVEASVNETLRSTSWLDVSTILPPAMSATDVATLLDKCLDAGKDIAQHPGQVLATTCIVSTALITVVKDKAEVHAVLEADKAAADRRKSAATASTSAPSSNGAGSAAGIASVAKKGVAVKDANDSDDDWSMGSKKGKKGKAGGANKAKAKSSSSSSNTGAAGGKQQKGAATGDGRTALSLQALTQLVLQLYPDMEDAGPSGALAKGVAEQIRPAAVAAYQQALESAFTSTAEARRKAKDAAVKALEEQYGLLQLYEHGCKLLQDDESTQSIMQRHLLRSTGTEALDVLLTWCKWEFAEPTHTAALITPEQPAAAEASSSCSFSSPAERSKLVKALPPDVGQPLAKALEAAYGADMQAFASELVAAAIECGIRLNKLDKKTEKALLSVQRAKLTHLLELEQTPAAALALAVPLLVLKVHSQLLNIPGRAISGVLAKLQPELQEGEYSTIQQFHQLVVDSLKLQTQQVQEAARDQQQQKDVEQLNEQLAGLLPKLKALVGIGDGSNSK